MSVILRPNHNGIRRCVSDDDEESRFSLEYVAVMPCQDAGKVYLAATDSRILVIQRIDGEYSDVPDKLLLLPPILLPSNSKERKAVAVGGGGIRFDPSNRLWTATYGDVQRSAFAGVGRFPSVRDVLIYPEPQWHKVTLNVDLLRKITDAMGTGKVTLAFQGGTNSPIAVAAKEEDGEELDYTLAIQMQLVDSEAEQSYRLGRYRGEVEKFKLSDIDAARQDVMAAIQSLQEIKTHT